MFQAGASSAFDADQVEAATVRRVPATHRRCTRVLVIDPTAGSSDTYAFGVVGWRRPHDGAAGPSLLEFSYINGVEHASRKGWTSDRMVAAIAKVAHEHQCSVIHADQFERFALASAFANAGFRYVAHAWTQPMKERAVEHVRGWLADGVLALPRHERMRKELLSFEEKIAPSGALTFRGRAGGHDDFAMLVVLAALVDIEEGLPGSTLFDARARALQRARAHAHEVMHRLENGDDDGRVVAANHERMRRAAYASKTEDAALEDRLQWNHLLWRQRSPV